MRNSGIVSYIYRGAHQQGFLSHFAKLAKLKLVDSANSAKRASSRQLA
jgi:hypothetical protein